MGKLQRYIVKGGERLRMGYTTGSCAAGAAKAAAAALLGPESPALITLHTPSGEILELDVESMRIGEGGVSCAVRKDAGDDPDVTDGALVFATVSKIPSGIEVLGGEGVGRVTRGGLQCQVGEAAINPVPMKMIRDALGEILEKYEYTGGLQAVISVPGGAALAGKTFNPRLGIEGGISILGTSGLVEPMSERAIIETIRAGIDAHKAGGNSVLLLTPGNYGREFAKSAYGLSLESGVKCSNYIGEALDYAVYSGFDQIVLLGHGGKLVKLAAGIMNTHSSVADGRMEIICCHAALAGLDLIRVGQLYQCVAVEEADALLRNWKVEKQVWDSVAERIQYQLEYRVKDRARIGFVSFLSSGVVMESEGIEELIKDMSQKEMGTGT